MESIYKMAKSYYPKLWNRQRIDALHDAGKLTLAEYYDILGEEVNTNGAT